MKTKYSNGSVETHDNLGAAVAAIRDTYPDAFICDSGGFEVNGENDRRDGDSLWVWPNEAAQLQGKDSDILAEIS